jgi:hypothetical protein
MSSTIRASSASLGRWWRIASPELQAKSRHLHLGSLGRYVQLGEQTSAQVTAEADPAARRRHR